MSFGLLARHVFGRRAWHMAGLTTYRYLSGVGKDMASVAPVRMSSMYEHDGPERDLLNFPAPKILLRPLGVRLGFVPAKWFDFFYEKTGVTGPYLLGIGLLNFLLSKEFYIIWVDTNQTLAMFVLLFATHKIFGERIRASMERRIDANERSVLEHVEEKKRIIEDKLGVIGNIERMPAAYDMLAEARRENVNMQTEAEYRERLNIVFEAVRKQLDYLVAVEEAKQGFEREYKNVWVTDQVLKSITPKVKDQLMDQCIERINQLAAAEPNAAAVI